MGQSDIKYDSELPILDPTVLTTSVAVKVPLPVANLIGSVWVA